MQTYDWACILRIEKKMIYEAFGLAYDNVRAEIITTMALNLGHACADV